MSIRITSLKLAVAAVVAVTVSTAVAQGPGGGRGMGGGGGRFNDPSLLLGTEQVQKELELSDEQKTSVQKLADDNRQAMMDLRNSGASPQDIGAKMRERHRRQQEESRRHSVAAPTRTDGSNHAAAGRRRRPQPA